MSVKDADLAGATNRASFLAHADPRLYRTNVFRITGLPGDATTAVIRRRRQDLRMVLALGTPVAGSAAARHPLDPPPGDAAVRDAFEAIKDPARRLHDEVFWFWGPAAGGPVDPVVERHDRAVDAHLRALDLEEEAVRAPLPADRAAERDGAWEFALRTWAEVLHEPAFWQRIHERVLALDDARLTTGAVRRLRTEVPLEILLTGIRTAIEADSDEVAARHRTLLQRAGFAGETVEQARKEGVDPLVRAVDAAVTETYARLGRASAATDVDDALRWLYAEADPALRGMARVLGDDHRTVRGAADDVAQVVVQAGVKIHNLAGDDDHVTSPDAGRRALALYGAHGSSPPARRPSTGSTSSARPWATTSSISPCGRTCAHSGSTAPATSWWPGSAGVTCRRSAPRSTDS